jgi:hypothetical protein
VKALKLRNSRNRFNWMGIVPYNGAVGSERSLYTPELSGTIQINLMALEPFCNN